MFCLQGDLLAAGHPETPDDIGSPARTDLGAGAWLDFAQSWLPGSDAWFRHLADDLTWSQSRRPMYDRMVDVPRLTANFDDDAVVPTSLRHLGAVFEEAYGRPFRGPGCNWYRSGDDSVAWHADRVTKPGDSIVALVSLGARRPFRIRPIGGGSSRSWQLGRGDLLVMGGTAQAHWEHGVPKVRHAYDRISLAFRG